jgi:putative oxidoreductase
MQSVVLLLARVLMAYIFLFAGYNKMLNTGPTVQFMQHLGLPGFVAYLVILLELCGGMAVLLGVYTRIAAVLLAGFCLLTALLVHFHPDDPGNMLHFMKNLSMAGGFLVLAVHGAGRMSLGHQFRLRWS